MAQPKRQAPRAVSGRERQMTDSVEARVKKAVEEASKLAEALPEALKVAGFNKAFDALVGNPGPSDMDGPDRVLPRARRAVTRGSSRVAERAASDSTAVPRLLEQLNRAEHPEIRSGRKTLHLSMLLLKAASDKCQIQWLTPAEISQVLKDKFRLKVETPAVRMALGASEYVDRKPAGGGFAYTLMEPGEAFLKQLPALDDAKNASSAKK
jgi:hypothetical protein